jgi:hypothetical protein
MSIVAVQGSLESFKVPEVLTFLNSSRKTGMLTVSNEGREAYVFCREGSVVYAASNQEGLRLAALLTRKNQITKEQAENIDDLMLRGGGRFGDVAVRQGVLSPQELDEYLKVQVSEVLYDTFLWKDGTFMFYEGFDLPPHAVTISVDLTNLIMEGARRIDEWEECLQLLPDSMAVFRVVSRPETEKITLSADEWKILFLINGQRPLEDLCRDSAEDPLTVYSVVYGLLANRLIEEVERRDQTPAGSDSLAEATLLQSLPGFSEDKTFVEQVDDDTSLLVSSDARLTYKEVVRTTVAQLAVGNGELEGTVLLLTEPEYTLGRHSENNIQLLDLGISGHHARIFRGPEGYVIEDLKSRNGTWLNGTRVFHSILHSGDDLRLGATNFTYQVLYDGAARTSLTAP